MPSIVISYRRADTGQIAGRIFDRLEAHFGHDSVFMDVDGIPIGADFRERVKSVLGDCEVVLALVGPHWADGGSHRDRLSDEADWVRIEVEMALANKVPVIPVLIDQSQFPPAAEVPASVRDIVFKQAARVDTGIDFGPHVDRLIRAIDATIGTKPSTSSREISTATRAVFTGFPSTLFSNRNVAIGIGALVAVVVAVLLTFPWPHPSPTTEIVPPAPAPAASGDILQAMESAPMSHDVRTAFERARGASAAATHAVNEAREALARARDAAEKAARRTPGYDDMDSTNSQGVTRHYAGGVSGGQANGFGVITIASSGSTYSGQMQEGGPAGVGVYTRGKLIYEGQFRDGDFNGVGVLNMDSASDAPERFSGEFKNGQLDGDGLRIFAPGHVYFGHWVEGKRSGYGVVFDSTGKIVEQGIYRNGELIRRLNAGD